MAMVELSAQAAYDVRVWIGPPAPLIIGRRQAGTAPALKGLWASSMKGRPVATECVDILTIESDAEQVISADAGKEVQQHRRHGLRILEHDCMSARDAGELRAGYLLS
jgi:hypothetical protein